MKFKVIHHVELLDGKPSTIEQTVNCSNMGAAKQEAQKRSRDGITVVDGTRLKHYPAASLKLIEMEREEVTLKEALEESKEEPVEEVPQLKSLENVPRFTKEPEAMLPSAPTEIPETVETMVDETPDDLFPTDEEDSNEGINKTADA